MQDVSFEVERNRHLSHLLYQARHLERLARELGEVAERAKATGGDLGLRLAADAAMQSAVLCVAQTHTIESLSALKGA